MDELRAALERAGFEDVKTLLQSGNVVLTSSADRASLEREFAQTLRDAFGFAIAVVVRTRAEVRRSSPMIARRCGPRPRPLPGELPLAEPYPSRAEELARADLAPERVAVHGREVYAWQRTGSRGPRPRALVTARNLGVEVTARNWRTVTKLLEPADA